MVDVFQTSSFVEWLRRLRDRRGRHRILERIRRLSLGNRGDSRGVGDGINELRLDFGPGYRVYYVDVAPNTVTILVGGTKRTQERDIRRAKEFAKLL